MSGPAVAFSKLTLTCVAGVGIAIGAATTFAIGRMKLVEAESIPTRNTHRCGRLQPYWQMVPPSTVEGVIDERSHRGASKDPVSVPVVPKVSVKDPL
jgi:hypothetical protein